MSRPPRLAASEFQTLLDELLAGASRQALEQWIRSQGEGLPSGERQSFLDDLANRFKQRRKAAPAPRDLLADIDAFIEDLAAGSFYVEETWDKYGRDATGEDDWVEPMDDLFAEAMILAKGGEWTTATEALRRLLMAFELEGEERVFGGENSPTALVQTDLTQATLTYLQGVLETSPAEQRAENLIGAFDDLYSVPEGVTLVALGQTSPPGEPDARALGALLMPLLRTRGLQRSQERVHSRAWLPEALVLQGGLPSLLAFLREDGCRDRGAVRAYLQGAVPEGDWEGVAEVATRARDLEAEPAYRAWLLPLAAEGARRTGHPERALALLEAGWRERPGTTELLTWLDEPGTLPWPDRLAAALADPPATAERGSTPRWRFLLGSWDALLEQARRPAGPWATEGRHWAFLVLAMAALEGRKPSASTQLWQAWLKLARLHPQYYWKEASPIAETAPRLSLVDLLRWKIQREPLDVAAWARIRRQLGAIALGWATEVLKASQRGSYPEAALWLAAAVEVHRTCGESAQAEALPRSILEAFPRHRAFRQDWERLRCT